MLGKNNMIMIAVYLAILAVIGAIFGPGVVKDAAFNLDSASAEGRITGVTEREVTERVVATNTVSVWDIDYSFSAGGGDYSGTWTIRDAPEDEDVTVFYDPGDPSNNRLEKWSASSVNFLYALGAFVVAVLFKWLKGRDKRESADGGGQPESGAPEG